MSETPPNPFDPEAVAAFRASRETAVEPTQVVSLVEAPPAAQAEHMTQEWARESLESYMDGMAYLVTSLADMAGGLESAPLEATSEEQAYMAARLGKDLETAAKSLYQAGRGKLWDFAGGLSGAHSLDSGGSYEFKQPRARRSTDLKKLAAEFPSAYQAVVKETRPEPGTPGALYLKAPNNTKE